MVMIDDMKEPPINHPVVIVGAGLSGLACATRLSQNNIPCAVLEATDRVGGRVRTDRVDGFTLDHGFQVLLTAYPACRELLDYEALNLKTFQPGARVWHDGKFRTLSDPWRRPAKAIAAAMNPVGTLGDKLRVALLRRTSRRGSLDDLYHREAEPTIERLRSDGFSEQMIDEFFRPFLGGVFLDETLSTSSRMLEFVFRMFAAGDIAVPADGMAAIPRQLADSLPRGSLRFNRSVDSVELATDRDRFPLHRLVTGGETISCEHLVIATPSDAAARLLDQPEMKTNWSGTTNLYFAADGKLDSRGFLMLRGDDLGPIQTAVVMSDTASSYAPAGKSLISISVDSKDESPDGIDDEPIVATVVSQLKRWFGERAGDWTHLRTYRVPYSLPKTSLEPVVRSVEMNDLAENLCVIGDYRETPSIQGAMNSGMRAADAIMRKRFST